jgi:hypothetical protein
VWLGEDITVDIDVGFLLDHDATPTPSETPAGLPYSGGGPPLDRAAGWLIPLLLGSYVLLAVLGFGLLKRWVR